MTDEKGFDQRHQYVQGSQINIEGNEGPVAAGNFYGSVFFGSSGASVSLPIPHQIPLPPLDFTGRDEELQELQGPLGRSIAIIGLRGMGGVGKSALAFALAERLQDSFPDGQIYIKMLGTSPEPLKRSEVMAQIIRSYTLTLPLPENEAELANLYRSILDGKRALLLFDDARDDNQVRPLLPPAKCCLVVTTRRKFVLPGMIPKDLDVLTLDKAVDLLQRISGMNSTGGPSQEKEAWEELARLCGCLPVALRAAGSFLANTPGLSPKQYIKALQDERKRLGIIGKEGVDEDVVTKFSLSYSRLASETAQVFRLLSIFTGDFGAQAEENICQDEGNRHLNELVRWSLVEYQRPSQNRKGRYYLHDLVRLFAAGLLEEKGGKAAGNDVLQRHAEYYKDLLFRANIFYRKGGTDIQVGLALFDREWANIRAGQSWAENKMRSAKEMSPELEPAFRLCMNYPDAGAFIIRLRLFPEEWIRWLEAGLYAARALKDLRAEGAYLGGLGLANIGMGKPQQAIEFLDKARVIASDTHDRRGEGRELGNLGIAYANLGEMVKAIEFDEQALTIAREIGDEEGEGNDLGNLGIVYAKIQNPLRAIELHKQALAIHSKIGNKHGKANDLGNLGLAYASMNNMQEAILFYDQQLAITREIGDKRGESNSLWTKSLALNNLGERTQAKECAEAALKILEEFKDPRAEKVRMELQEWEN
jgi:tetratricopeptide (TPR) repeat protein